MRRALYFRFPIVLVVLLLGFFHHPLLAADHAVASPAVPLAADSAPPNRIIVADDSTYAPFAFLDSHGKSAGITVDIWKLWSRKTGIPVEFRLMQWDAALKAVQNGEADVVGGIFKTEGRQKSYDFTDSFLTVTTGVFFHEQIHGIRGIEDLHGFSVGIVKGDSAEEQLVQRYPNALLLEYPGTEVLIRAAVQGEIKVFVADSEVARFYLAKYDQHGVFHETTTPVSTNLMHAAVRQGNGKVLAVLQDGFSRISAQEREDIVAAWTGKSFFSGIPWPKVQIYGALVAALIGLIFLWNINLRKSIAKALRVVEKRNLELQESQDRLKAFFDLAPFSCIVNDLQGRFRMVNKAFCEALELREEDVLGRTLEELGHFGERKVSKEMLEELLHSGEVSRREAIYSTPQGPRYVLLSSRLMDFGGEKLVLTSTVDITERKRIEEALRESENSFTRLFQAAPVPMAFASDVDGYRGTTWNEAWYQTFGYPREQAEGRSGSDIGLWVDPDDRSRFVEMAKIQNYVTGHETRLRRYDGSVRNCALFGRFIGKTGHQLLMAIYLDITERKEAEIALRESEERFSKAFRSSPAPMVISDADSSRFIDFNNRWQQMIGYSRAEMIGNTAYELGVWREPEVRRQMVARLREEGRVSDYPGQIVTARGEIRDVVWSAELITIGGQEVMLTLVYDFTEWKRAEDALRESESYNKLLFHDSHIPLIVIDPATRRLTDCNAAAMKMYGVTERTQLIGRSPVAFSTALQENNQSAEEVAEKKIGLAIEKGSVVFEWKHVRPDGTFWVAEVHLMSFVHKGKTLIQGALQDITGRKQAEEEKEKLQLQLLQSQKMESVGQLAGGVAHDYNNMLGVIIGHTELAMLKSDESHPFYRHLVEILNAAKRSADLTQQLLAFARRQTIAPKILDLNASVTNTLQMLRLIIGENIEVAWLPEAEVCPVKIDPGQFDQLLMNLCVNARDAMDGMGRISIETRRLVLDEATYAANSFLLPGDYVLLTVSDNGCGMDRETQTRIFEPFYTTKGVGQGTGLGLATVYGIVKQNNGFINVYSEPGQGTTFRIYLPRFDGQAIIERDVEIEEIRRDNKETILVVEDEAVLLDINTTMLRDLGYTVLAARSAAEAIRLVGEYSGRIDLLMTDVVMPEMNGRQLEEQISRSNPETRCLFMSGYTANVISHHGVLDEGVHFIQKPFSIKDLATKVRETLDAKTEGRDAAGTEAGVSKATEA